MKKLVSLAIVLILFKFKGISQTSDDTTICIPKVEIQRAINIIETAKISKQELGVFKLKVTALENIIVNKDSLIDRLSIKNEDYKNIIQRQLQVEHNNNIIIGNQNKLQESTLKKLNKQKSSKWITLVLGLSLGYLISK